MASKKNSIKVIKVTDLESDLICAICKENHKEKLLNCGHSFCKSCLTSGMSGGQVNCGLCRQVTNVPGRNVDNLKNNFTIKDLEEKISSSSLNITDDTDEACGECSDGKATAVAFCKDCNNSICAECVEDHGKKKRLLSHMIVPLSEKEEKKMQIFVKTMDGKTLVIFVGGPDDSVDSLKETVSGRTGVPKTEMRLICRGRQLEKGKLADYDVESNCTLHLVLRLRGGCNL